jgi:hypothetical protein
MTRNIQQSLFLRRFLVYGLAGGFALACAILAGSGDYRSLALIVGAGVCLKVISYERFHLPLLIMLSMMSGRGLLLGGLGYWDAFALIVVASVMLRLVMKKGNPSPMTGRMTWVLMAVFCGIFTGHVVANFFGVGVGSKGGFQSALVAAVILMIGYFVLTERFSFREIERVPWLGVFPGAFEGTLELANYFWAAAIPVTYILYSNSLNWETLLAMRTGSEVTRLAGLRALGFSLGLLCSVRLAFVHRLFSWRGAGIGLGLLCAFALVLVAGYRSFVIAVIISVSLAVLARNRLLLVLLVLSFVGLFGGLWVYNEVVAPLPLQIQRSLCWLPGRWDPSTMYSANVGFEWRREVWSRFMTTTFPEHPWFGRGVWYSPTEAEGLFLSDTELFAVTQRTHSGFFSALDHVGMVGTAALILASLRACWNCAFLLLARRRQLSPWMLWIILLYASEQGWYWVTGNFRDSFVRFALCMCLLEVIRRKTEAVEGARIDADDGRLSPGKAGAG